MWPDCAASDRRSLNAVTPIFATVLRRAAILFGLVALSCGEGDGPPTSVGAGAAELCREVCATLDRCMGGVSPTCARDCQPGMRGYMRRITTLAVGGEVRCLQEANACPEDLDELFVECIERAGEAIEPTARAEEFCGGMSETFFECAWYSSPRSCSQAHARYTADALAAGRRCTGSTCDNLESCIEATLWSYGD